MKSEDLALEFSEKNENENISSINPPSGYKPKHLTSMADYNEMYRLSINEPHSFWSKIARENIEWFHPFKTTLVGDFSDANISWFQDGILNACYNCVDRHALETPNKVAFIWEQDEPDKSVKITFKELLDNVCSIANVLLKYKVTKGDTVAIYMPMIPEAAYAMLACARIGAVHSVIFAGFSSDSIRDRINDASCKFVITSDQGKRGGKLIHLKKIIDEALIECPSVQKVLMFQHTNDVLNTTVHPNRDLIWKNEMSSQRPFCPPVWMNAEDPLFILYTSGSTGKPKGLVHVTGGYLVGASTSLTYTFDLGKDDIFGCMADVGWITGHSYIVYGPLTLGVTSVIFESIPTYPDPGRYWKLIDDHKVTHFYTAPTAIRALKRFGDEYPSKYHMNSLRVLGSVGEPINPEAWLWYYKVVGKENCTIVDTYWQTETGSFLIAPTSGVSKMKPGSASFPVFGVLPVVLEPTTGEVVKGKSKTGVLCLAHPIPSMARTILNDHERYVKTYFKSYAGYYFTGDGVSMDSEGFYWIKGRVDDVINVSGHRLSTAEIESALTLHPQCAEAAVIGANDDLTGQAVVCFCSLKTSVATDSKDTIKSELAQQVRKHIGPFATPKRIIIVPDLPKTRSGKVMRRILRKIVSNESSPDQLGDLSTLSDPSLISVLIAQVKEK